VAADPDIYLKKLTEEVEKEVERVDFLLGKK
jgi:hypothetical protein